MTVTRYTHSKQAILWEGRGFYYWNPTNQHWQKCTRDMVDRITAGNPGNLPGKYRKFDERNTAAQASELSAR